MGVLVVTLLQVRVVLGLVECTKRDL